MSIEGLKIVVTGKFKRSRKEIEADLEGRGADVTSAISGKTKLLIAGSRAGSKLAKAEAAGIPIIDEAQLEALLTGELDLDAVLHGSTPEVGDDEAATSAHTPFPVVIPRPRTGTYTEHYPDSTVVKKTGELVEGKAEGRWAGNYESGAPWWFTDYEGGLKQGEGGDFYEGGAKLCYGKYAKGERAGEWTWWWEGGGFKQKYLYDDEGKTHGPYAFDNEDGSLKTRGEFWHGRRHGSWDWRTQKNHERIIRGYWRGQHHGEEAGWYYGGQLAYRHFWDKGHKVGEWEDYTEDGTPTLKATYDRGRLVEKRTWADGKETVETFTDGLNEALANNPKKLDQLAKKVAKAKDEYAKQDILSDAATYNERGALLLLLWRSGRVDLAKEPALWEMLRGEAANVKGAEIVELLRAIEKGPRNYSGHLPGWPRVLDELVCEVFQHDPEPFEASYKDLPKAMRRGVAFVLARAGKDVGDVLKKELPRVARVYVDGYGFSGNPLCWWLDGELDRNVRLTSQVPGERRQEPNDRFYEFLSFFGNVDDWPALVLKEIMKIVDKGDRVRWDLGKDAFALATFEQLVQLLNESGYEERVTTVFQRWRKDDADFLLKLAAGCEKGRGKKVANVAVLRFGEEGRPVPDELVELLEVDAGSGSLSWVQEKVSNVPEAQRDDPAFIDQAVDFSVGAPGYPQGGAFFPAVTALSEGQQRALIERTMEQKYGKARVALLLHLVSDAELWERGLEIIDAESNASNDMSFGLGLLPKEALPLLVAHESKAMKTHREAYRRAIVMVLARLADAGDTWDADYDQYVRTDIVKKQHDYHYVMPLLRKVVHRLPVERAEAVLLANLDSSKKAPFCRAVRFVGSHPTQAVLERTVTGLLEIEATLNHEQNSEIEAGLKGIADSRRWIAWMLRNGGGAGLKSTFERVVGHKEYPKLLEEIAKEGVETAKELDAIDKLALLAEKASGAKETVYVLRNLKERAGETWNLRGGTPPGIGAARWPKLEDEPMEHLFTLDLQTMPLLAKRFGTARTMSVFCATPGNNEAYEPYNGFTAVVFSTPEQVAEGALAPPEGTNVAGERGFEPVAIQVPTDVWHGNGELRTQLFRQGARVLGQEQWVQGDEGGGGQFVMQFDESFVGINLGDSGVMYVYADTAFWQCY
ncbi:MAG: BRCT domain-containing protein [Myxococcota bacterium]